MSSLADLRAVARMVAADGTDPDHLAAIAAWTARPRRHPEALRRRLVETLDGQILAAGDQTVPAARLAALVPAPSFQDREVACALLSTWRDEQVRVALVGDPQYPQQLAEGWPDVDAPTWLAWRGEPPEHGPAVAIVGARRASSYGTAVASWLGGSVSDAGVRVVSGGALGIDAAAHEGALEGPGGTTVVLGCGHAVDYPRPHSRAGGLFARVIEQGGSIVSESLPHEPPQAFRIRARNRIVAGLADAVVVVEGGERSGALLTASAAVDRGRAVLAVPGDVRAPGSIAPHRLLAEGAGPCTAPRDVLEVVGAGRGIALDEGVATGRDGAAGSDGVGADEKRTVSSTLPADVHAELALAWPRPLRLEDLAERSGREVGVLLAAITRARVAGEIAEAQDGVRLRRAPSRGPLHRDFT